MRNNFLINKNTKPFPKTIGTQNRETKCSGFEKCFNRSAKQIESKTYEKSAKSQEIQNQ